MRYRVNMEFCIFVLDQCLVERLRKRSHTKWFTKHVICCIICTGIYVLEDKVIILNLETESTAGPESKKCALPGGVANHAWRGRLLPGQSASLPEGPERVSLGSAALPEGPASGAGALTRGSRLEHEAHEAEALRKAPWVFPSRSGSRSTEFLTGRTQPRDLPGGLGHVPPGK